MNVNTRTKTVKLTKRELDILHQAKETVGELARQQSFRDTKGATVAFEALHAVIKSATAEE